MRVVEHGRGHPRHQRRRAAPAPFQAPAAERLDEGGLADARRSGQAQGLSLRMAVGAGAGRGRGGLEQVPAAHEQGFGPAVRPVHVRPDAFPLRFVHAVAPSSVRPVRRVLLSAVPRLRPSSTIPQAGANR